MNESNGKKQTAALWILGVLVVILIAIIVGLFIMQAQTRNKELVAKDEKIAQIEQELAQVKNQNDKAKNDIANTITENLEQNKQDVTENSNNLTSEIAKKDETIKQLESQINKLKNSGSAVTEQKDIIEEIIANAEETIRSPLFNESSEMNAIACKVKQIQIYDAEYMKIVVDSYDNNVRDYESYGDYEELSSKVRFFKSALDKYSENIEEMPVFGTITFMIEYDGNAKGSWAGSGPKFMNGKYAIGSREFEYKDGKLMLNTGGTFMPY